MVYLAQTVRTVTLCHNRSTECVMLNAEKNT